MSSYCAEELTDKYGGVPSLEKDYKLGAPPYDDIGHS